MIKLGIEDLSDSIIDEEKIKLYENEITNIKTMPRFPNIVSDCFFLMDIYINDGRIMRVGYEKEELNIAAQDYSILRKIMEKNNENNK